MKSMHSHKISLAFSPCPNDCFIFDALVNNKIDTEGLVFDIKIADIEALNKAALHSKSDCTKISFFAFTSLWQDYYLLRSGAAMGENCGPLIIAKKETQAKKPEEMRIGIPGKNTSAALLLSSYYPRFKSIKEMLFSDIENALEKDEIDWGLIIHENRFTFQEKGFVAVDDLGEKWHDEYALPVPLGGIIAHKRLGKDKIKQLDNIIKKSLLFAMENPESSMDFIKKHAQNLKDDIIAQHIELYVNHYSVDMKAKGEKAVLRFFEKAKELNYISDFNSNFIL